jgi:uncharacterized membrane protein
VGHGRPDAAPGLLPCQRQPLRARSRLGRRGVHHDRRHLLAFFVYDALFKSPLGKDLKTGAAIGFAIVIFIVLGFIHLGGFGYRGYVIHTGAMFGTIMLMNVWMRIWPAQQKILTAVKQGTPPDAALVAMAGARSRHNTYMSVPLVWMMINSHTSVPFSNSPVYLFVMILLGWGGVYWLYGKSGTVKGF